MKGHRVSLGVAFVLLIVLLTSAHLPVANVHALPQRETLPFLFSSVSIQSQDPYVTFSQFGGNRIVYSTMNADGSNKQAIAETFFTNPRWIASIGASFSPDGHILAFGGVNLDGDYRVGDALTDTTIHLLDLNTNIATRVVTEGYNNYWPVWSPDGTAIAYLGQGEDRNLRAVDVATGEVRIMLDGGVLRDLVGMAGPVYGFDWSPDGNQLAADASLVNLSQGGYNTIFVMNADGSGAYQVMPDEQYAMYPAWGPEGDNLYYTCDPSGVFETIEICVIDLMTSQITQVTHLNDTLDVLNITDIDVSTDGQIVFVLRLEGLNAPIDIYRYDIATSALVNLTADVDDWVGSPRWVQLLSPHSVPTAASGPDQTLTDTDASGSEPVTLDGSGSSDPDGTIVGYSWTENEVEIATGATPTAELGVGVHTITLTVTDDEGLTASDEVVITVEAGSS